VLDGNFALGCESGTDYPQIHVFQCMLERTYAVTNEVLEPITFVLAYPSVHLFFPSNFHSANVAVSRQRAKPGELPEAMIFRTSGSVEQSKYFHHVHNSI